MCRDEGESPTFARYHSVASRCNCILENRTGFLRMKCGSHPRRLRTKRSAASLGNKFPSRQSRNLLPLRLPHQLWGLPKRIPADESILYYQLLFQAVPFRTGLQKLCSQPGQYFAVGESIFSQYGHTNGSASSSSPHL